MNNFIKVDKFINLLESIVGKKVILKESTLISLGDQIMDDDNLEELEILLQDEGFVQGKDFEWAVAMGDDMPHAIEILNSAILSNLKTKEAIDAMSGDNPYDRDEELDEIVDPQAVTSKDRMRISDIIGKSQGNKYKARDLANRMANSITDSSKAYRRYQAAENANYHDLALIFYKRYSQLEKGVHLPNRK